MWKCNRFIITQANKGVIPFIKTILEIILDNYNFRQLYKTEVIIIKEKRFCKNCGEELVGAKRKNIYCNNQCQNDYEYKQYIKKWKNNEISGTTGGKCKDISQYIRRYLFEKNHNKCSKCGWNKINPFTNSVPLEIHHKDGNCLNNKEDNLDLLCPNCHSLTDTFGSLNKGKSKRYKYKYQLDV